jgi:phage terminase large subunit-like protein
MEIKKINKEALKIVINGTKDERMYLCSKDFRLFLCYYFTEYIKYRFSDFHFEWFNDFDDLINDRIRELAIIAFRESAKTSFAKIFLLWLICHKKRSYINVDSFDKENSERILFDIVIELQTNKLLIADYGQLFNSKRNQEEATQKRVSNFITNNDVRVEAHSTQESVRGRIHGSQRPDFLLLDDFETNKTKDSKAYTEQVIGHINEFKAGLDSLAKIIYLGNYITEFGSIQSLFDRAKTDSGLRVRNIPVIKDGEITWPDKYAMTDIEAKETGKISLEDKKKQLGSQVFSAEMMNEPIDEETQEFFKKNFKYKTKEEVLNLKTRKFATIDTALSKGADSDFTGITKNYVDKDNNWHLSGRQYKINSKTLIDLIFQMHDEGFEKIGIEQTAYSEAIEPFFLEECKVRNKYPYVVQLKHGGIMKETRIRGLIPRYEAGTIYHIEGDCEALEDELLRFPKGLHDDVADSAQYQNKIAEPPFNTTYKEEPIDNLYDDIGL